jgi:GTPase SAR1 family protein
VTQIKTYSWDNAQVILVGNKCDMEDERVISFERGKQLADQLGVEFFETSAKENVNVKVSNTDIAAIPGICLLSFPKIVCLRS